MGRLHCSKAIGVHGHGMPRASGQVDTRMIRMVTDIDHCANCGGISRYRVKSLQSWCDVRRTLDPAREHPHY